MNTKLTLWKYVLLGRFLSLAVVGSALLFTANAIAQPSDTTKTFNSNSTRPVFAYRTLTNGTITFTAVTNANGMASGGVADPNGANIALAFTDDAAGMYTFVNDISIAGSVQQGSAHSLIGFLSLNTGTAFTGQILGGKNITVNAADGEAIGVLFRNEDGTRQNIGTGAEIRLGNITVDARNGTGFSVWDGAYGFSAGGVDASATVLLGNVTARAALANDATAVEFRDSVLGDVSMGTLTATSAGRAQGISVTKAGDTAHLGSASQYVTIGDVNVKASAANGEAFGIFVDRGSAYLNLKGNINADANTAYGILVEGEGVAGAGTLNILLGGTVNISGTTEGISADNLNVDLAGNTLTSNSTLVSGTATITGNGHADLGIANVGGNTIIGDGSSTTTVALDNSSQLNGTDNKLNEKATLVLGDADEGIFANLGEFTVQKGKVIGGVFTDWKFDANNNLQAVRASSANMSDGYLAAFGVHNRYTVWNAVRDKMISGSRHTHVRRHGHGYHGQAPCDPCEPVACDPCAPLAVSPSRNVGQNVAWANYIGRSDTYRSSYNNRDWKLSMEGVQVGTDLFRGKRAQLGVLFGYETGKTTNAGDQVRAEDLYIGAYTVCVLNRGADIRGVFGYGWQDYKMNRNNLYTSSFKGQTLEGTLELGKRTMGGPWSLRPVLAVDVSTNKLKGASEVGGITYGKTDLTQVFTRAGGELRYIAHAFTFNSGAYYAYDVHGRDKLRTSVSNGIYNSQLVGTNLGRSLLLFNLGGSCQVTQNFAIFGGYDGQLATDRNKDYQGLFYAGGSWNW